MPVVDSLKMHRLINGQISKLENSDMPYCCLKSYRELFPFQNLTDNQLRNELTETKLLKDKKLIPLDALNVELPDTNNCYMTAEDFQSQYKNKNFFLMHINIRSLIKILKNLRSC